MADTGTDWAAEADKAEAGLSRVAHHPDDAILFVGGDNTSTITLGQARAAAVGLRRLAQLDTAIGDPATQSEIRQRVADMRSTAATIDAHPDGIANEEDSRQWRRDAELFECLLLHAAVLGSGEQPERTEP